MWKSWRPGLLLGRNICGRFFRRRRVRPDEGAALNFEPVPFPSIDAARQYAMVPVMAGIWRQHEMWDGTYDVDELLDAHEMLAVQEENKRRAKAAAEAGVS